MENKYKDDGAGRRTPLPASLTEERVRVCEANLVKKIPSGIFFWVWKSAAIWCKVIYKGFFVINFGMYNR